MSDFVLTAPTPEERAAAERRGIEAHEQFHENIGKTYQNAYRYMDGSPANRKKCTKCRALKRREEYYKDSRYSEGIKNICKTCWKRQQLESYHRK